uniref:Protein tyrosine phosphatase receptor type T n=1 Tax=Rousettus aegyptiacus TaxID=9407 RepID=A0A7J8DK29_ROUAE|nr:protein tyrosine phosphatase receptor type T [Rousettus aegyptiacus]
MSTTAIVVIAWPWGRMGLPGSRLTRGRNQCWTQRCPQGCMVFYWVDAPQFISNIQEMAAGEEKIKVKTSSICPNKRQDFGLRTALGNVLAGCLI